MPRLQTSIYDYKNPEYDVPLELRTRMVQNLTNPKATPLDAKLMSLSVCMFAFRISTSLAEVGWCAPDLVAHTHKMKWYEVLLPILGEWRNERYKMEYVPPKLARIMTAIDSDDVLLEHLSKAVSGKHQRYADHYRKMFDANTVERMVLRRQLYSGAGYEAAAETAAKAAAGAAEDRKVQRADDALQRKYDAAALDLVLGKYERKAAEAWGRLFAAWRLPDTDRTRKVAVSVAAKNAVAASMRYSVADERTGAVTAVIESLTSDDAAGRRALAMFYTVPTTGEVANVFEHVADLQMLTYKAGLPYWAPKGRVEWSQAACHIIRNNALLPCLVWRVRSCFLYGNPYGIKFSAAERVLVAEMSELLAEVTASLYSAKQRKPV